MKCLLIDLESFDSLDEVFELDCESSSCRDFDIALEFQFRLFERFSIFVFIKFPRSLMLSFEGLFFGLVLSFLLLESLLSKLT